VDGVEDDEDEDSMDGEKMRDRESEEWLQY